MIIEERAFARAGLLGNPSDGYYGKTISISVRNFSAQVVLKDTSELQITPQSTDLFNYQSIQHLAESINRTGYYGGIRLIQAAIKTFFDYCTAHELILDQRNFTISYSTSIPRQIGMGGSSAIVTATIRSLMRFYNISIPQAILPNLTLSAEKNELGISAGLQDRVIQAYEGCLYMDFAKSIMEQKSHGEYHAIEPTLLPKLYLAYKTELGKVSGKVLDQVRLRYEQSDAFVIDILEQIGNLALEGWEALQAGDHERIFILMNENFNLRSKIMNITESNMEMVETARICGASAKFAGSGGSIIGICKDEAMFKQLESEFKKINACIIEPLVT